MTILDSARPVLRVQGLSTTIETSRGPIRPVERVDLEVHRGETVGIVGESGSGKSMTVSAIMRLHDERAVSYEGTVELDGVSVFELDEQRMRAVRGGVAAMIFQDPMTSLNPVMTIGRQITESLRIHRDLRGAAARAEAVRLLETAGILRADERLGQYPHQLSGGLRQRVMIAIALAGRPQLLIADEPTTALDATTQAQVLALIRQLSDENDMATLLITHDMGVVAETCSRVIVMYLGQVVEESSTDELFAQPSHPYTLGLLSSIPDIDAPIGEPLNAIKGAAPSPYEIPSGCRFADRCPFATPECSASEQTLTEISPGHLVRCRRVDAVREALEQVQQIDA